MRIAVLTSGRGWHARELERALGERGHECLTAPIARLVGRIGPELSLGVPDLQLETCDAVLVRGIPRGSLEQIVFRVDALHLLAASGVRVVNSAHAIERTVDKFFTSALLQRAGVPTPRTIACEGAEGALEAFVELGGDVIVKPLFGSRGLGMVRVQDPDLAYRVFHALEWERAVYYLQEALSHGGRDVRAFVLGDRVVAAMERIAGGWRTNVARGARVRPLELSPEQEQLCVQAARAVGADYAGVDLLPSAAGGQYVLEVNGIPGWQGLQSTTAIDLAAELVAHLEWAPVQA